MSDFQVDQLVSAPALGALLGKTDRWVRGLENDGVFTKAERGLYPLAPSLQAYVAHVRESEIAKAAREPSAKTAIDRERARKLRLENDARERELIPMDEALAAIDFILAEVRNGLAGVAARVSDDVRERRRIDDQIDAVLGDLDTKLREAGAALEAGRAPVAAFDAASAG